MKSNLRRALGLSVVAIVAVTGLLAPLDRSAFDPPIMNDIGGILISAAVEGILVMFVLVVPFLVVTHRSIGSTVSLGPPAWALLGSLVVAIVAAIVFGAYRVELAAPWPALIAGGAVCGWLAFPKTQQRTG